MENKEQNWLKEAIEREALPQAARTETTEEFCKRWGIPPSTYYYNVSKEENRKLILKLALNYAKKYTSDVLEKIGEEAKNGNMKAAELYLKFIEQLNEKFDLTSGGEKIFYPEEKIKEIARLILEKENGGKNNSN
jgi:3-hydroxy-3-methylglutaryl CoA synthase